MRDAPASMHLNLGHPLHSLATSLLAKHSLQTSASVPPPCRLGDLPESKQLLAELGEGSRKGGGLPPLAPASGPVAALNAVALGTIMLASQAATSVADRVDRLLIATPFGACVP